MFSDLFPKPLSDKLKSQEQVGQFNIGKKKQKKIDKLKQQQLENPNEVIPELEQLLESVKPKPVEESDAMTYLGTRFDFKNQYGL